jgi:hypothetical protein
MGVAEIGLLAICGGEAGRGGVSVMVVGWVVELPTAQNINERAHTLKRGSIVLQRAARMSYRSHTTTLHKDTS